MSAQTPVPNIQHPALLLGILPAPGNYFNGIVTTLAYVYLLRVPLLIALFVLILFPLAALSLMRQLLQNLFVLSVEGTFWTTALTLILCWSLVLTSRLVLLNGYRFRLPQVLTIRTMQTKSLFVIALVAVPLVSTQFLERHDFGLDAAGIGWRIGAILAGTGFAYVVAFLAMFLTTWVAPQDLLPPEEQFPAPNLLLRLLHWANKHGLKPQTLLPLGEFLKRHLPKGLWIGYLDPKTGIPWGGHWLAFSFAVATGALTIGLDIYRQTYLGEASPVPAICYVVILLLNLNWLLSFLTFLLDRYRIPLLVPLLVLCVIGARLPSSDHYFRSRSGVAMETISPYDVLHARLQAKKPVILVATAGGGIQAGAWTAEVLSGIEDLSKNTWKTKCSFADSLTLVSSVSGGATGSMFFLNLYGPDTAAKFQDQEMTKMNGDVKQSSLDDVAWALVYRDLTRIFLPLLNSPAENRFVDRGYALEETWSNRGGIHADLSNWRVGVKEGNRPAVIFNSTVSETGEPLLLSTTDLAEESRPPRRISFYSLYHNTDVPVVTAVRLAATFPYVTPAARKDSSKPEYHMIDGGYYDNPGVASLVAWLDEGLVELVNRKQDLPDHILIIQIRSFPDEEREPEPKNRGWFYQVFAPIKGLLSVRTTGQLVHDHDELSKLARLWSSSPKTEQGLLQDRIRFATFTFNGNDAPLSWAMNESQKNAIGDRWQNQIPTTNSKDLARVHCTLEETSEDCRNTEKNGPY